MRCNELMELIRAEGPLDGVTKILSLKSDREEAARKLPLDILSQLLNVRRNLIRNASDGCPVVDTVFYYFLSEVAVPEHLIKGLIKNFLSL